MIIINLSGGLGNQMFQFAFANNIMKKYNLDVHFSTDFLSKHNGYELKNVFNLNIKTVSSVELKELLGWQAYGICRRIFSRNFAPFLRKSNFVVEPHFHYWKLHTNFIHDNSYMHGYWQSHKYFFSRDEILSNFNFRKKTSRENLLLIDRIKNSNSVSIHVRRGDYLNKNSIHCLCEKDYYDKAISKILDFFPNAFFYIFSDDAEWVSKNFKSISKRREIVTFNSGFNNFEDMRLMSLCKHNIISNSSFSWWAAYLNASTKKTVISPKKWFISNCNHNTIDLIPDDWIRL
jgi:hypothetical protein